MNIRVWTLALCIAGAMVGFAAKAAYPERPIMMIVPFAAGGASDIVGRAIQTKLSQDLGQSIVIENKVGASGRIGAAAVAQAKPDGYTLLVGSIGVLAINQHLYSNKTYDPGKDFDLLTLAVRNPNVLVVHPSFPAKTMAEFMDHIRKNPGKVTFASSSVGASDHLTTFLFWQKSGTSGTSLTYRGSGPLITDLLGGHIQVSFRNLGEVSELIKSGQLRLLAVTSGKRIPEFPDAPTMAEAGVSGVEVFSWQGIAAPKGLPADVRAKLVPAIAAAFKDPAVIARFKELGFETVGSTSEAFTTFQAHEAARWKEVVETGNITAAD